MNRPKGEALIKQYKNTSNINIDYVSHEIIRESCDCVKTIVTYDKDFGDFEDRRYASVIDECEKCKNVRNPRS